MATDQTGRPTSTIIVRAPDGRTVEFTGNIWEILRTEANASFLGYTTATKEKTA